MSEAMVHLSPAQFTERETTLLEWGPLAASGFRFSSGVCGLRLSNERGELVALPFQGQQIWSARFDGRELTMASMFDEPQPTRVFLDTFGGFLQHCGVTSLGGVAPAGQAPLHGELPNAPYQTAHLVVGEDERGAYMGLGGAYRHTTAFMINYQARPLVRLYAGSSLFRVSMRITNLKRTPMDLLYLTHVNFRPVDHGRLAYSALATPEHVRVRADIPAHIRPAAGYVEFVKELAADPTLHHVLTSGLTFDPEICFFIDYLADEEGWAHSMQLHPGGETDYIAHRPGQQPQATRWISRTPDQDAIALAEPGTVKPGPYQELAARGEIPTLAGGDTFYCEMEIGSLTPAEAAGVLTKIERILAANR
jgi:hypothetical protein